MESLIAVGIGICIGFSPVGRIPAVKLFIKAITGGQYMFVIPKSVVKRVPYVETAISWVGLAFDVKEIVETATPVATGDNSLVVSGTISAACSIVRG